MVFRSSWRMFKSMQDSAFAVALLIYALAVLYAWRVLPGGETLKLQRTLLWPGAFFALSWLAIMATPPLRSRLSRHLWISFQTGFGQSVTSVLVGVGVIAAAAGLIFWQTHDATRGGRYPAGVFSGYGAGMGLLLAQVILVRALERNPEIRRAIEEP